MADQEKGGALNPAKTVKRGTQLLFGPGGPDLAPATAPQSEENPFKNLTTVNVVQNVVNYNIGSQSTKAGAKP